MTATGGARTLSSLRDIPVTRLSGLGPKKVTALESLDPPVESVYDLVTYYPRRYLDRTAQAEIRDLRVGEEAMVLARVKKATSRRTRQGRALVDIDVFDGSSYLKCTFFN
ncbi:MAG TPA: DNA helicase RecG, partial [Acidimicrobiales bacterium]|nr:DNA helicase RecG [Acidimicrobiales bacterium]